MIGSIVPLQGARLAGAVALSDAAGWNQTAGDWRRLVRLEPDGCFGLELDGAIVATTTVVCYGQVLAWIGMVVTDPAYRKRGFGRRLMEHALEYAERRAVEWIKLDGTDLGQPLYRRLGFEDECIIERWVRPASHGAAGGTSVGSFAFDHALDLQAFGADRALLVETIALEGEAASLEDGYALARPGRKAFHLGPCVARDRAIARELIASCLARHPGDFNWDVLSTNREAWRLARELGFEPARRLVRMVRPGRRDAAAFSSDDGLVYAAAGFEYG